MIENIIEKIILGSVAGYITNDIAISMLFDEIKIGPLSVGGVIVKTRDEFEERIAEMIERDIINHHSLSKEIDNEEFRKNLMKVFKEYFEFNLAEEIKNKKISDIPKLFESKEKCLTFLEEVLPNSIKGFLDITLDHMTALDLISENQISYIQNKITYLLKKNLEEHSLLEEYIMAIYTRVENDPITILFPEETIKNFSKIATKINGKKITAEVFDEVAEILNLKEKAANFENLILGKRLKEILGEEQSKRLLKALEENLKAHFNSPEGELSIWAVSEICTEYLKNLNMTITSLLSPFFKNELEEFLEKHLPTLISHMIEWVKRKESEIENALEEAIDESISSYDPMKRSLLEGIRKKFLQDIVKKFQLIEKIIEKIESTRDSGNLASELSREVIDYLNKVPISEFFKNFNPTELIFFYIKNGISNIQNYLPKLLDLELGKIVPEKTKGNLLEVIKSLILNMDLDKFFQDQVQQGIYKLKDKEIREILPKEILQASLPQFKEKLLSMIEINEGLKRYLSANRKSLSVLLDSNAKELLAEKISKNLISFSEKESNEWKELKFSVFLDELKQNKNLNEGASEFFVSVLNANLESLIEGNVGSVVEKNLKKLSNEEIKEMMREFMGKELKPINILGAGLGALIGGASSLLPVSSNFYSTLLQIPVYSIIGYFTNVLAIQGLFKPYEKKLGLQGVIPKEKPRFAKKMGEFVDKELLNRDTAVEMLKGKEEFFQEKLKKKIAKNNYEAVHKILENKEEELFQYFISKTSELILKNKNFIAEQLSKNIMDIDIDEGMTKRLEKSAGTFKELSLELMRTKLKQSGFLLETSSVPLKNLINPNIEKLLDKLIKNKLEELLASLQTIDWKEINHLLSENGAKKFDYLLDKTIGELLGENISLWKNLLLENPQGIQSAASTLLKELIEGSSDFLSETLAKKLKNEIDSQQIDITESTIEYVTSRLSFMEKIGYAALGGDKIIGDIVERFTSKKMPELIDKSIDEIKDFLDMLPKSELNISISQENLKSALITLISTLPLDRVTEGIAKKTPRQLMEYVSLRDFGDILSLFEKENVNFLKQIASEAETKRKDVTEAVFPAFKTNIDEEILSLKLNSVLNYIQAKDKVRMTLKFSNLLLKNELFDDYFNSIIRITLDSLKDQKISFISNPQELEASIGKFIEGFFSKVGELHEIYNIEKSIPQNLLDGILDEIETESKDYVLELLLAPLIKTINNNSSLLLSSLNIGKITEEEISSMDSREIHDLFNSFAETYFRKLEIYGLWGGLFALPILNILIFIKYILFLRKQKRLSI